MSLAESNPYPSKCAEFFLRLTIVLCYEVAMLGGLFLCFNHLGGAR